MAKKSDNAVSIDSRASGFHPRRERSTQFEPMDDQQALWSREQSAAIDSLDDQLTAKGVDDPSDRYAAAKGMVRTAEPQSLEQIKLRARNENGEQAYVYAFASRPSEAQAQDWGPCGKKDESTFYMTETEYKRIVADCQTDGKLDAGKVKSGLALPCENRCDQVVRRPIKQDHEVWQSTCCATSEQVHAHDGRGREFSYERTMAGGGQQIFCLCDKDPSADPHYGAKEDFDPGLEIKPYENHRVTLDDAVAAKQAEEAKQAKEAEIAKQTPEANRGEAEHGEGSRT